MAIMDENLKPLPVGLSGEVITQEAGEGVNVFLLRSKDRTNY